MSWSMVLVPVPLHGVMITAPGGAVRASAIATRVHKNLRACLAGTLPQSESLGVNEEERKAPCGHGHQPTNEIVVVPHEMQVRAQSIV